VTPPEERGIGGCDTVPCLKKAMIPDTLMRLVPEEVSHYKRTGGPYNLDNNGRQKQVRLGLKRERKSRTLWSRGGEIR
jgi:hypothetical protein